MKKLVSFLVFVLLAGCHNVPSNQITEENPLSSYPPEYGVVIGSMVKGTAHMNVLYFFESDTNPYSSVTLKFRNFRTGAEDRVSFRKGLPFAQDDFESGKLFAFALPPGEYAFHNLNFYYNNGTVEKSWWSEKDFSIPFTVRSREVMYIGEIKSIPRFAKNTFGIEIPSAGYFIISDQSNRDIPKLKSKFPDINWSKWKNSTLKSGNVPPHFVVFK